MKIINLDVSGLPAPEPFQMIIHTLANIAPSACLKVTHRQQPKLLYKPLLEQGYCFHVQPGSIEAFEIFVWRNGQPPPSNLVYPCVAQST